MHISKLFRCIALTALVLTAGAASAASTPKPFTATYQVLRNGSPIGESTLQLRSDGANWVYTSRMRGTSGLASLLGASVDETSHFRWHDGHPEALSYDYRMQAAIKSRQREVHVDWSHDTVRVVDDGKTFDYAAKPGLVERHSMPLALGYALESGANKVALPVAVKDRVEMQRYAVTGKSAVQVPAGRFDAVRVDRTDDSKDFSAWYVPSRYPVPVKLAQRAGGHLTMLLKSFRRE
ncbi:DUF3108 domain-containing protein [Oleiagrimonas soli]|uniref:DUF3108 domain-containing protein n=1 Tax=Oleiagrimonas soli TaxID=1543381 RepID=A0A099CUB6_9GAMM|nr:DUF3108 domain-containing protein [Oleiagrimonas soli]KGI77227.1 hypothetical protein LF63_0111560 [Oleiagrimonas soli]MBB6185589.1 hypothetical protein [Oleiagrimonas soli]